jgi:hypothetical protein
MEVSLRHATERSEAMPDLISDFPEEEIELPERLLEVIANLPAKIDRWEGAEVVTRHVFQTTKRTVESWPLPWEYPNGRAIAPPASYLKYALLKARRAPISFSRGPRPTWQIDATPDRQEDTANT